MLTKPKDKISAVRAAFFIAVGKERAAQDRKWGKGPHPIEDLPRVLGEEVGEVCRAINDGDPANLREELIQVAAVCLKYLEAGTKLARRDPHARLLAAKRARK